MTISRVQIILLGLVAVGCLVGASQTWTVGRAAHPPAPEVLSTKSIGGLNDTDSMPKNYSLAFFLSPGNPFYASNLQIFERNLKRGDFLFISGPDQRAADVIQKARDVRAHMEPGINVLSLVNFRRISDIVSKVPNLPKGLDYVMYDYEGGRGYSPEFTLDENMSAKYFAEAEDAVHMYDNITGGDAKLLITPSYGQLDKAGWNWGYAASHVDAMDMQLQAFTKDPDLPKHTQNIVSQIRKVQVDNLVLIQVSLIPSRGTVQDNVNALKSLSQIQGIDAFLIFYKNTRGKELGQFFSMLQR